MVRCRRLNASLNIEDMGEQAKLVAAATKILDELMPEEQREFLRRFDVQGWEARPMREALMAARAIVTQREARIRARGMVEEVGVQFQESLIDTW